MPPLSALVLVSAITVALTEKRYECKQNKSFLSKKTNHLFLSLGHVDILMDHFGM